MSGHVPPGSRVRPYCTRATQGSRTRPWTPPRAKPSRHRPFQSRACAARGCCSPRVTLRGCPLGPAARPPRGRRTGPPAGVGISGAGAGAARARPPRPSPPVARPAARPGGNPGRIGSVIEIRALQAPAHEASRDEPAAMAALVEALTLARPQGHMRVFADEGSPMGALLGRLSPPTGQNRPQPGASRSAAWPGWCRRSMANLTCRAPGEVLPRRCRG